MFSFLVVQHFSLVHSSTVAELKVEVYTVNAFILFALHFTSFRVHAFILLFHLFISNGVWFCCGLIFLSEQLVFGSRGFVLWAHCCEHSFICAVLDVCLKWSTTIRLQFMWANRNQKPKQEFAYRENYLTKSRTTQA